MVYGSHYSWTTLALYLKLKLVWDSTELLWVFRQLSPQVIQYLNSPSLVCLPIVVQLIAPSIFFKIPLVLALCPASWYPAFHMSSLMFSESCKGILQQISRELTLPSSLLSNNLPCKLQQPYYSQTLVLCPYFIEYIVFSFGLSSLHYSLDIAAKQKHRVIWGAYLIWFPTSMNHNLVLTVFQSIHIFCIF